MKNIQIIDRAENATFSVFQVTDEEFSAIFPAVGQDIEFIEDFVIRCDGDDVCRLVKTTLNNGTARFTLDVWLGTGFANKVCQFVKPGSSLTAQFLPTDVLAVSMSLRIYDA